MTILPARLSPAKALLLLTLLSALLVACGGGGGGNNAPSVSTVAPQTTASQATGASPQQLSAFTTEGFDWLNLRRQQIGLAPVSRNTLIEAAAQNHSNYQQLNDIITHDEVAGRPGFTGEHLRERLAAVGYTFTQSSYSFGEVISATTDGSGKQAAENLIGAIYHRYVIFEPMFRDAGAGAAQVPDGYTYFTVDFTANGLTGGIGRGNLIMYPFSGQQGVDRSVFSDRETPDPVAGQDEVGYPISVHADIVADLTVQSFTMQPHGGAPLAVRLLTSATDANTPGSAAAIIPVAALTPATTYDVQFSGTVDRLPVSRAWSFTTR